MISKDIETVSVMDLSQKSFEQKYLNEKPVIIKNYICNWPAYSKWNIDFFEKDYSDHTIQVRYFEKNETLYKKYIDVTMGQFIRYFKEYEDFDEHLYLSGWEISKRKYPLLSDIEVPSYFKDDYFNFFVPELMDFYRMWIFIGHPKVQLSLHKDKFHSCSWIAMMMGKKQIRIFNAKSHVDVDQSIFTESGLNYHIKNHVIQEAILSKGDLMYIPAGWYHELKNIDQNIMLTGNFLSKNNVKKFMIDYLKNSSRSKEKIESVFQQIKL